MTESIFEEVSAELSYQFEKNANFVMASEAYAENIIKLSRLLNGIERGQMAINFEKIEVKSYTFSKQALIMFLSHIFGGFLGCTVVLIIAAIFNRRAGLEQP